MYIYVCHPCLSWALLEASSSTQRKESVGHGIRWEPGLDVGERGALVRCGGRELPSKRLLAEASNSLFLVDLERLGKV